MYIFFYSVIGRRFIVVRIRGIVRSGRVRRIVGWDGGIVNEFGKVNGGRVVLERGVDVFYEGCIDDLLDGRLGRFGKKIKVRW